MMKFIRTAYAFFTVALAGVLSASFFMDTNEHVAQLVILINIMIGMFITGLYVGQDKS